MMAEKEFEIGDLVWAKMKNFPFWPAKIVSPPAVKEKVSPTTKGPQKKKPSTYRKGQHYVFFFGSQNYAWISHENIVPHSEEMLNKPVKKKSGSYAKAIEEIVEASLAIVPKDEEKDNVENGDFCNLTEIPSLLEDEFCKKPRLRIVRRDRPTKQQDDGEEMEKSSQKRNLPEEPTEELSLKKCRVSLPPDILSNTDNPATVIRPLADQSRAVPECAEPESAEPECAEPECAEPECAEPECAEPECAEPECAEPEFAEPECAEPECAELPRRPSLDLSKPTIPLKEYMKPTSKKIGFIGLGMMGQRIVKNLLHSGHDVSVWNRTPEKCKKFVDAGAKHLSTPADIVENCDIIFCCISGPQASKSLVFGKCGILEGLGRCLFEVKEYVEMTSIDSRTSQDIAEAISHGGGKYLEAPIIGSLSAAEEGTLVIISAGNHEVFNSCDTCFFAMCKNSFYLSAEVGYASNMNLIHSMLISTSNAVMAEQMAVIDRHNIPKVKLLEVIHLDPISCPLFSESGQAIVDQNFVANTSLKYQQQNLQMALALGSSFAQPLRLASAANELYKSAKSLGYSEHDMSAVYIGSRR